MRKKIFAFNRTPLQSRSDRIVHGVMFVLLVLLALSCLYPFLLVLSSSFQPQQVINEEGYKLFASEYTLETYEMIFENPQELVSAYIMTIVSTVLTVLIGVSVTATCGYVMSRRDYKYRKVLAFFVLFTMLFNGGTVPMYILLSQWLKMRNSIWVLVLPICCGGFNILLMKGYFSGISTSVIESAKLDGASEFLIFRKIILPMSKPAVATMTLFLSLASWNDYWQNMLYTDDAIFNKLQFLLMRMLENVEFMKSMQFRQYAAARMIDYAQIPSLGMRMALCVLAAGPILVIFPFFQKYFARGINVGSIKE